MSSRSIISSSLGCKCSFDHSLHFVSIYQSQDSVNLNQQHSENKATWATGEHLPQAGGVAFGLVCFLNHSPLKTFQAAVEHISERREAIVTLSRQAPQEQEAKQPPVARSPSLLQQIGNKQSRGSPPLAKKPLLCPSMRKAPGADLQPAEVTETNRPNSSSARSRSLLGFNSLYAFGCSSACSQDKAEVLLFNSKPRNGKEDCTVKLSLPRQARIL